MIEVADLWESLAGSSVFANLKEHELDVVAGLVREGELPSGQYLFRQHDLSDCMYIIRSGSLGVERELSPRVRVQIAQVGPRECLGEMGLVSRAPRTLDALALEAVRFWTLSQADFEKLCAHEIHLGAQVLHNIAVVLCGRLVATNEELARLLVSFESVVLDPTQEALFRKVWTKSFRITLG